MDLENYYRLNFALMQYHKYSLTEIENLIPWERDVYVGMLQQHLEEEELKQINDLITDLLRIDVEGNKVFGKAAEIFNIKATERNPFPEYHSFLLLH